MFVTLCSKWPIDTLGTFGRVNISSTTLSTHTYGSNHDLTSKCTFRSTVRRRIRESRCTAAGTDEASVDRAVARGAASSQRAGVRSAGERFVRSRRATVHCATYAARPSTYLRAAPCCTVHALGLRAQRTRARASRSGAALSQYSRPGGDGGVHGARARAARGSAQWARAEGPRRSMPRAHIHIHRGTPMRVQTLRERCFVTSVDFSLKNQYTFSQS